MLIYTDGSCVDKHGGYGYAVYGPVGSEDCNKFDYKSGELFHFENGPTMKLSIEHIEIDSIESSEVSYPSTNNKSELFAIYKALIYIRKTYTESSIDNIKNIIIYSDSMYSIQAVTKWIYSWKRQNWKKSDGQPVLNRELIMAIDNLMSVLKKYLKIEFTHVPAHSGIPENEFVDRLAAEGRLNY